MKLNYKNKFIATFLVMLIILPFFTNSYVLAEKQNSYIEEATALIMKNLKDAGFIEDEIKYIIERNPITEESLKGGLLSNEDDLPRFSLFANEGDKKTTTVNISQAFVQSLGYAIPIGSSVAGWGLSEAEWVDVIVKAIGWKVFLAAGVAVGAAAYCVHYYLYGYNGVKLTLTWTYMYGDQSMAYFWGVTGIKTERY